MKKINSRSISLILGIILIIVGFLLSVIPSLTYPNYRLYKNGEDVTYFSYIYDPTFYLYQENDEGISFSSSSIKIDVEEILNDNNFSLDTDLVMFNINFDISINEDITDFELVENGEISFNYLDDNLIYFDGEINYSLKEIDISSIKDINIYINKNIIILKEDKKVEISAYFSSFYLEVYKA